MARRVKVELIGDAKSLNKAFASAGLHAKRFGTETSRTRRIAVGAFKAIGAGGLVAGGLIVKGLKDSISAAIESQQVQAQTAAALKSTGSVANVTAKHIEQLANAISQKTGIDDEAIQSTENLLLTFTRIRNEVGKGNDIFDQATVAVQDMSVALKQDAKSSAIQLGKALGDPIRGMTALRRVGVTFTDSQADLIKKLVESGQLLKAQKIVLREVQKEFGGSARAAGRTFGGQLALLRVNVENLQERIGKLLLPMLTRWVRSINNWLSKAKNQRKVIHDVKAAVALLVIGVRAAVNITRRAAAVARTFSHAVGGWKNAFKIVLTGLLVMKLVKVAVAIRSIRRAIIATQATAAGGLLGKGGLAKFAKLAKIAGAYLVVNKGVKALSGSKDMGLDFSEGTAKDVFVKGNPYPKGSPGYDAYRAGFRGATPRSAHTVARDPAYQAGRRKREEHVHHTHVHLDGKEVAHVVTKHQRKGRARTSAQRRGRYPGHNHGE